MEEDNSGPSKPSKPEVSLRSLMKRTSSTSDEAEASNRAKKTVKFSLPEDSKKGKKRPRSPDSPGTKKKTKIEPPKLKEPNRDIFCWKCHRFGGDIIPCVTCPRVYHFKCTQLGEKPQDWICFQCKDITQAENEQRSPAISPIDYSFLLKFVLKRMRQHDECYLFEDAVDLSKYTDYLHYIVQPMFISRIETKLTNNAYESCESFLADLRWMVHNCCIFNQAKSYLTKTVQAISRMARHDCSEIHNCPDCFLHANTMDPKEWFLETCRIPHILVWAKLRGHPYWPGKAMSTTGDNVDVRFFGDHNRALVPVNSCFLYSKEMPKKQKKTKELAIAMNEIEMHIEKLKSKYGEFIYPPPGLGYVPRDEDQQRKLLLPGVGTGNISGSKAISFIF